MPPNNYLHKSPLAELMKRLGARLRPHSAMGLFWRLEKSKIRSGMVRRFDHEATCGSR